MVARGPCRLCASVRRVSTGHPLLRGIVDDAALFPPGSAAMPDALAAHPHHKRAAYAELVGRFLCPASRVGELIEVLHEEHTLALGLIGDTGVAGLPAALALAEGDHRLAVEAVEIRPDGDTDLTEAVEDVLAALPPLPAFVELPRTPGWTGGLDAVAAAGRGAKLRTGGLSATAFPTADELATFVLACVERDVPFKCTAGLHHAVHHRDAETGFVHHGFLNLLLATHAAVQGADRTGVAALLDEEDTAVLRAAYDQIGDHDARRTRGAFVGFGSCSVLEPVADLDALGLL